MSQDISGLTLAEACDEYSPEQVVEYIRDWCRHEADNLEEGRRSTAEIDVDKTLIEETNLRALADRLDSVVEV